MVQSRSSSTLALNLVPTRLSDISLAAAAPLSAASDEMAALAPEVVNLLVHPGASTELLLRLRNQTNHPLQFTPDLTGSIPMAWCQTPLATYELPPAGRQDLAIAFQVPADFFETLTDIAPGTSRPLNYAGRLDVYSHTPEGDLVGVTSEHLALMVRPMSPYVKLLPQVYQEVDLVGRLMAIAEQTFSPSAETWFTLWAYLNPLLAPQAMLGFLAHWVGWRSLPQLTWEQQRRLIHRAMELYRWRGTAYGLRLYLHLATGLPLDNENTPEYQRHISILEPSRQGAVFGQSEFQETTVFGGGQGFHFVVVLRPPTHIPVNETLVRAIIDQERPAFCTYEVYLNPMS